MGAVAHHDKCVQVPLIRDRSEAGHLLLRIDRLRLRDDAIERDSLLEQVIPPHGTFSMAAICNTPTSQRYDDGRDLLMKEVHGMVQPGVENWRRASGILGGAKNRYGV